MNLSRNTEEYICPWCKRPVIVHDKNGVVDGPAIRPDVSRWCTGGCESLLGLFDIVDCMVRDKKWTEIPDIQERIIRETKEVLVQRDQDYRDSKAWNPRQ